MKKLMLVALSLCSIISSKSLAKGENNIPLNKAWGLACNFVDKNGLGTTDYQITTYTMGNQKYLHIKVVDSLYGDNNGDALLTSVVRTQRGNKYLTYSGVLSKSTRGNMFRGSKTFTVMVYEDQKVVGKTNVFRAHISLDNFSLPQLPAWAQARDLQCELVP